VKYPGWAEKTWHYGVDIKAKKETPLHSPADAKVIYAGKKADYGYTVDILLEDGRKMRFSSLHKSFVKEGDKVKAGEMIGKVGTTGGSAFGPHVHLEVYKDGEPVDPLEVKDLVIYKGCCDA